MTNEPDDDFSALFLAQPAVLAVCVHILSGTNADGAALWRVCFGSVKIMGQRNTHRPDFVTGQFVRVV